MIRAIFHAHPSIQLNGIDFMDKASIAPIPKLVQQFQSAAVSSDSAATGNQKKQMVST